MAASILVTSWNGYSLSGARCIRRKSSEVGKPMSSEPHVISESESEIVSSSSDDEDDDETDLCDVFAALDNSPDAVERIIQPLGHGVLADVPLEHENMKCQLDLLDVLKRNYQLQHMKLNTNERLVSEIYETSGKDSVRMPDDVIINIPVRLPRSRVRPEKMYDFFFMIEHKGGWKCQAAEYKKRNAKSSVKEFRSLCVIARLKPEEHVVSPEGFEFVSEKDSDVTVNFPQGAVDEDTDFKFIVETVDPKRCQEYKAYNPTTFGSILGFSTSLHVQHVENTCLHKQVEVRLPVHQSEAEGEDDEGEVVFLRWEGESVELVDTKPVKSDGCYTIVVNHFSGYSAVRKSPSATSNDVLTAARILAGKENLCSVLSFIRVRSIGPSVLLDVVESCKADKVAQRHRKQGLKEIEMSRSRDIPITDRERIKIELGGNLVPAPGIPRDVYNLTFVKAASSNNVTFPLHTKVSSAAFSIINFRGAKGRWVHSIHFTVGSGPRPAKNALLSPTTINLPVLTNQSAFQPEVKFRPVSDVPVTRVIFKQKTHMDSQSEDNRPSTRQSALTFQSTESELDSLFFDRPHSRGMATRSPSDVGSSPSLSLSAKEKSHGHPMLSEKSLQVLSEQLSLTEWNRVLVELNMPSSDIGRICEEAGRQNFSPAFRLLVHWLQSNKGRSDRDLINDLVAAFTELGRNDMAEVIRKGGRTQRNMKRSDFKRHL